MQQAATRDARLLTIDEVAVILRTTRRTIERRIVKGKFPAPVSIGDNSRRYPLSTLTAWAKQHGQDMAAEFERVASMPLPTKTKPPQIDVLVAAYLSREHGERIEPGQTIIGHIRPATPAEHKAQLDKFRVSPFKDLTEAQQIAVALHLCPALRAIIGAGRPGIATMDDDTAFKIAVEALS